MDDKQTILAVDDNLMLLALLVETLTVAGYHVLPADSGELALASVAANPPDLILLDIHLGGISGLEVCRRLKEGEKTRHIPIILVSGFAAVNDWVEGLGMGAADYITKPFQTEELLTRVKTHLALGQANATLEQQAALLRQANDQLQAEVVRRQAVENELRQSLDEAERSRRALLSTLEDQKRTESALRESEDLFRAITDNAAAVIFMKDTEGRYLHVNRLFEKLFHVANGDIYGKTDYDLFSPEIAAEVTSNDRKVLASGHHLEVEEQVPHDDGIHTYLVVKFPLRKKSGEIYAVCGIATDITERKLAEEEKDTLKDQLNQAQKMESIGILAGGIAHDFNNILGVILGYAEMAKDDSEAGSQVAQDLDRVLKSAHRAKELVKQILAFSRQSAVDRIPIKIQPLVKESLKMLRASIPTTIAIKDTIQPQGGAVLADPTQVHQIVMNLCINAFHAMEKGGGVLTVGVERVTMDHSALAGGRQIAPGEYVLLTVSDTGAGIAPDIIDRIFDPYFTTKEIGKGTGMGLAITHGIIKEYGGTITVESTLGRGTNFHVYFPAVEEEAKAAEEKQAAPSGKGRILFVDDEELLLEMGRDMLTRLGYTVTTKWSSSEALELFISDPGRFDLVITDQTMPGMTGTDLARRLLMIRPELPIILCTGFSHLVSEESAKAIGIKEFALKPLTSSAVGQLVKRLLKGEAAG